jgi:hypothetical protein
MREPNYYNLSLLKSDRQDLLLDSGRVDRLGMHLDWRIFESVSCPSPAPTSSAKGGRPSTGSLVGGPGHYGARLTLPDGTRKVYPLPAWYTEKQARAKCAELAQAVKLRGIELSFDRPNPRSISPSLRARVLERDSFRCRRCRSDGPLVVDHILPVKLGGNKAFENLQALCIDCNAGKGARAPHPQELRE